MSPSSLDAVKKDGLKRTSKGEKSSEEAIDKTDKLLDELRPDKLRAAGISRNNNLYAYISAVEKIINITDGQTVAIDKFIKDSGQAVLRLNINPECCYVSDLDAYDAVKDALEKKEDNGSLETLCRKYWDSLIPLTDFRVGSIQRPEVMVTYDISTENIEIISKGS